MCMYLIAIANVIMFLDPYPLFISNWTFTMKIVKTNNNKKYVKTIYWQTQDQTPPSGRALPRYVPNPQSRFLRSMEDLNSKIIEFQRPCA